MDEDEEEEDLNYSKDRRSFEDKKNNFDIKRIMSEFIIKKEHFISYNKGDIRSSYSLSGWFILFILMFDIQNDSLLSLLFLLLL